MIYIQSSRNVIAFSQMVCIGLLEKLLWSTYVIHAARSSTRLTSLFWAESLSQRQINGNTQRRQEVHEPRAALGRDVWQGLSNGQVSGLIQWRYVLSVSLKTKPICYETFVNSHLGKPDTGWLLQWLMRLS